MFCCFSFFLHDIWVSWACCMLKYIYIAHARAVSSCCATRLKFMDFYLSQMGPITQIFIYDHFWSSPSGAHKEPWLVQPCTSVGDLLGNSHEPWARLSLLRPGGADKKKKQGSTSRLGAPQPFHHEQRRHKAGEGEEWPPTQLICPGKEICLMGNQEPEMLLAWWGGCVRIVWRLRVLQHGGGGPCPNHLFPGKNKGAFPSWTSLHHLPLPEGHMVGWQDLHQPSQHLRWLSSTTGLEAPRFSRHTVSSTVQPSLYLSDI